MMVCFLHVRIGDMSLFMKRLGDWYIFKMASKGD